MGLTAGRVVMAYVFPRITRLSYIMLAGLLEKRVIISDSHAHAHTLSTKAHFVSWSLYLFL